MAWSPPGVKSSSWSDAAHREPVHLHQIDLALSVKLFQVHVEVVATVAVEDDGFFDARVVERFGQVRQDLVERAGVEVHRERISLLRCLHAERDHRERCDTGPLPLCQFAGAVGDGFDFENVGAVGEVLAVGLGGGER